MEKTSMNNNKKNRGGAQKKRSRSKKSRPSNNNNNNKKKVVAYKKGPIWSRPYDGHKLHPELEKVLAKPFLATIHVSPDVGGLTYPIADGSGRLARLQGLHYRMLHRFFWRIKVNKGSSSKYGKSSSAAKGSNADGCLDMAISTGCAPSNEASPYAAAVWNYWKRNNHQPVLSQLPVVLIAANCITAGDYFTLHTDPRTQHVTLWLWELKTGYKARPRDPKYMAPPLRHVPLTPRNRFQLQVLLTKIAYEKELGLKIDGGCRVIHVWEVKDTDVCDVEVLEPHQLDPPNWTEQVNVDELYAALNTKPRAKKKTTTTKKRKTKTTTK